MSFSTPRYFAILPLARSPLSASDVEIREYDGVTPSEGALRIASAFTGVDVDRLAHEFCEAIDLFLSPEYLDRALPIALSLAQQPDPIAAIRQAQRVLAGRIASRLGTPYADDGDAGLEASVAAARARLEEELLAGLSRAFEVDAVVTLAASVEVAASDADPLQGEAASAPRLRGQVLAKDGAERRTLSDASVLLTPGSHLAFTFASNGTPTASIEELDAVFVPEQGEQGYDLGRLAVPLPLRELPASPAWVSQQATQHPDADGRLESARLWQYTLSYAYEGAVQDAVHVDLDGGQPAAAAAEASDTLPAMLLQFAAAWPAIRADLDAHLLHPGTDDPRAGVAMQWLAWIAERVSRSWPEGGGRRGGSSREESIVSGAVAASGEGSHTQTYDVFARREALGSVWVVRNAHYSSSTQRRRGNPAFVYRTPALRPVAPASPLIVRGEKIDMARYLRAAKPAPLLDYLEAFFAVLLAPLPGRGPKPVTVKVSVAMRRAVGPMSTEVPILRTTEVRVVSPGRGIAAGIAKQLVAWLATDAPRSDPGILVFHVAMFEDAAATLPLLQLEAVELALSSVHRGRDTGASFD